MQIADRLLKTPPYPFAELARLKAEARAEGGISLISGSATPISRRPSTSSRRSAKLRMTR